MRFVVLYLSLLCALFAQATKVGGSGKTKVGGAGTTKVSPVAAGYTLFYDTITGQTGTWQINDNAINSRYYAGFFFTDASPRKIGRIICPITLSAGSITGKTYVAKIWTTSGTSLVTAQATSTGVAGSNAWSNTQVTFDFPSPFTTTGGVKYGINISDGVTGDASNYASGYHTTPQVVSGDDLTQWEDALNQNSTFNTYNFQCQMYTVP